MAKFSKILISISVAVFLAGGYFVLFKKNAEAPVEKNSPVAPEARKEEAPIEKEKILPENPAPKREALPDKISISVPFTSQAPFAKWDLYHEEACEEASLIMLKYYLDKKTLTPDIAEKEIQKMIAFEIEKYGDYKDTDAAQTAQLFSDFYGRRPVGENLKVVYDFQKEDIKKYLSRGKPVVVPAAGRLLGNPNFTAPGPLYHNLVLTGYDGNTIITNDPGTRKGRDYQYDIDTLFDAIHDFPGKPENISQGRKAMIVFEN